jgi:lysozyme family protein
MRTGPAVTHTAPATTTTSFHHRSRVVIFDTFGYPFFPYWYPYWYGYYPYGYYPYGYYYYNRPVYGETYGAGSMVAEVQRHLAHASYYHGAIDGVVGRRTRAAIRAYERAHDLRVDGAISRQLIATMGLRE